MANYIRNRLTLYGEPSEVNKVLMNVANKSERYVGDVEGIGTIDFNTILKCPDELMIDCGGVQSDAVDVIRTLSSWAKHVYSKAGCNEGDFNYVNELAQRNKKSVEEMCEIGMKYIMNVAKHGYATWYEWSSANWGTSRNAENILHDDEDVIEFDTRWTPPTKVIQLMSKKFKKVRIKHEWATEDICGDYCGTFVYEKGKCIEREEYTGVEAIKFGCGLWDIDESEYAEDIKQLS